MDARTNRHVALAWAPAVAAALALGGCASLKPEASDTSGAGGTGGTGNCSIAISALVPSSFDGLQAGASLRLRVQGAVSGRTPDVFSWSWSAVFADGEEVPVSSPIPAQPSIAEIPVDRAGTYTLHAELVAGGGASAAAGGGGGSGGNSSGPKCSGDRTVPVAAVGGRLASFRLRVTPPAASGLPAQEMERQVTGGTASGGNALALAPGITVPLDVRSEGSDASNQALAAYVRLTDVASGAVLEGRSATAGLASLRVPPGMYEMLVVPDGDVAPALFPARSAGLLAASPAVMDAGVAVTGHVVDATGAGVAGVTVALRAGALPSTRAVSDAGGAFQVRARPGTFGVTVVSPLPGGTLEATLPEAGGLTLAAGAAPLDLRIALAAVTPARAQITVAAAAASSLGAAARVTLQSAAPVDPAATLSVGAGGPPLAMSGLVRASFTPASGGQVVADGLPRAAYVVTVYPGDASTEDALTVATVDLSQAKSTVTLARKVMMHGKLLPAASAGGARVLAVDDGGLPVAAAADAGSDGTYAIAVSPLRSYALRALPRPDQPLARTLFPPVDVGSADVDLAARSMPSALRWSGRVLDPSVNGVGGALVQAFCTPSSSSSETSPLAGSCADLTVPVAETVTAGDGSFELMLPDPGVAP
jgi:hypothetical protein